VRKVTKVCRQPPDPYYEEVKTPLQMIDRSSAEHYVWGEVCDGWRLVDRENLAVIAERVPPGAQETRHFHSKARQFFYILRGCAVIEADGARMPLSEGQGLEIPSNIPHQFLNESNEDVHFLVISQPTTRGDRTECAPA
jgi:mannose-6-phosphate isomerase-like protein (cupin superfamily)